jgi:hypothetical protein
MTASAVSLIVYSASNFAGFADHLNAALALPSSVAHIHPEPFAPW